jgi:hypothetical protein
MNKEQFDYWKTVTNPRALAQEDEMIAQGKDQLKRSNEAQEFQMGLTKKYDQRFWDKQAPMQDSLTKEANDYNEAANVDKMSGQAGADVETAFGAAQAQQQRGLNRSGVNPRSGQALAMGNQTAIAMASARANAENKTRDAAKLMGHSLKLDANAAMAGLSGFSSAANSAAQNWSGNGMAAGRMGMDGIYAASSMANSSTGGAAAGMYGASSQLRSNAIESAKSPGFDAAMGLVAGGMKMYGSMYSPVKPG